MGDSEQVELLTRFIRECSHFRRKVKNVALTEEQWQVIKLKLYDLIFEIETRKHRTPESGLPSHRDLTV
jgi:hypothetical protein